MNSHDDTNWYEQYRILGIDPGCEWTQVQQAYRRLAQSHHPDRFEEGTVEFQKASNFIIEINQAYAKLSAYFKVHGNLPGQRYSSPAIDREPITPRQPGPATSTSPPGSGWHTPSADRKSLFQRRRMTILLALGIAISLQYFWPLNWGEDAEPNRAVNVATARPALLGDSDSEIATEKNYFGPGSTMGEVHAIQGNPTHTSGSTWFYGNSSVTFVNGLVYSWHDDPDSPLKIWIEPNELDSRTGHSRLTSRFTYGSTKADVEAIQGPPLTKGDEMWDYGVSRVYFSKNRVVRWFNSPMQPLRVSGDNP